MLYPYIQAIIFFTPPVIMGIFYLKALYAYMHLYRKKINPDYPILPQEAATYLYSGALHKIILSPVVMMQIIFEKHKDKELAAAAKIVRILYLAYIGVSLLVLLIFFLLLFYS